MKPFRIVLFFLVALLANAAAASPIGFADLLSREKPVATKKIAYGADVDQRGELWLPDGKGKHPVVIMLHGGCWKESLPGTVLMSFIAEDLRASGIAVWNLEYRRLGANGAGYSGTFLDVATGVDMLRTLRKEYHLDLSHVVILGHSAGGQLALWAAGRGRLDHASLLYRANPLPIHAAVSLAGIDDLEAYHDHGPGVCGGPRTIEQLITANTHTGQIAYRDTSPAAMLPLHVRQIIVSGALDSIVPPKFGQDYAAKAKAAGDKVSDMEIEGAGHFELIDPRSDAWKRIKVSIIELIR